ncbi:MAG: sensor histidine kinase [Candidatus Limnocylindrus sp.]
MNRPLRLIQRINRWSALLIFTSITAIVIATSLATGAVLDADAQSAIDSRLQTRIDRTTTRILTGKEPGKQLAAVASEQKGVQIAWIGRDGEVIASSAAAEQLAALRAQVARAEVEIRFEAGEVTLNGIAVTVRVGTKRLADDSILLAFAAAPRNSDLGGDLPRQLALLIALSAAGAGCVYVLLRFTAFGPLNRALKREQRLIADASHEMRTTAAVISAGVELLVERNAVSPAQKQLLADLRSETHRLNRMVRDLLKRSNLPQEAMLPEVSLADLRTVIEHAVRRATLIAPSHVRVQSSLESLHSQKVPVLESVLESALDALLENAVRHAESRVLVTYERSGPHVNVIVDDDGPGIDPEHRDTVMQPFARIESNRGTSGSGLGLAIASAAAQRLGGGLTIEDSPLGGARLRLLFKPA